MDPKLPEFLPLWAGANGAPLASEDGRTAQLDSPEVVAALEYGVGLIEEAGGWGPFKAFRDGWGLLRRPQLAGNLFGSAFYIFLLRQFFLGLPRELFEAARVDGVGYLGLFWRIAVPLSVPALIITFVFELRTSWTDLMRPLIYLQDPALFILPRGLKAVLDQFGQGGEMKWEVVLAASVISTVPMIAAFLLGQRYFVQGIATTGRKG